MTDLEVIWKFELHPGLPFIDMPEDAAILSAGAQGNTVAVWARCHPEARNVQRHVPVFPTGGRLPDWVADLTFVGTAHLHNGLVFHIFDAGPVHDTLEEAA